ncbi:MAG: LPS assembly protein LptD [Alphaproteobacteria bacterium]
MARSVMFADRASERSTLRWAAAAAALMAASAGAAWAQPAPRPQQVENSSVVLEADRLIEDRDTNQVIADGTVEARYQGRTLKADRLIYDTVKRTIRVEGHVQIMDADGTVRFAEEAELDETLNVGVATAFSMRLPRGGTAASSSAYLRPDGVRQLNRVVYSACPVCEGQKHVTWTLKARRMTSDPKKKILSYRDVVLQFHGVPVFYLPYFAHADPDKERQSGLLFPDFGQSERVGGYYSQPIYWAISPYQDLTITPRIMSKVNPLIGLDYRKQFWSGSAEFSGSVTQETDFSGSGVRFGDEKTRGHIFGAGKFKIDDYWDWNFNVAGATDDLYIRRYQIQDRPDLRALYGSDLTRLVSQLSLNGQGPDTYFKTSVIGVQGLRSNDNDATMPKVLPRIEYDRVFSDPILGGQLQFQASSVNLVRNTGVNSGRISGGLDWETEKVVGPGLVFAPYVQGRTDYYRISDYIGTNEDSFTRSVGLAGVEMRYPMLRPGTNVNLLIEPIVAVTAATADHNQSRIPNEDSIAFELDDSNLFRPNVTPNYDLWESGERVAAGVRASAITPGATFSAVFGRRWKNEDDPAFTDATNLASKSSDYVGAVSADMGPKFGADVRFRLDDDDLRSVRLDAGLRTKIWRVAATARYFDVAAGVPASPATAASKELTTSVVYDVTRRFKLTYGLRRDLVLDTNLSQEAHLLYQDDCSFIELVYSRSETFDRALGPTEGLQIRIGLTSLGGIGVAH